MDLTNLLNDKIETDVNFVSSGIHVPGVRSRRTFRRNFGSCFRETVFPRAYYHLVLRSLFINFFTDHDRELAFERRIRPVFSLHNHAVYFLETPNRHRFELIGQIARPVSERIRGNLVLFLLIADSYRATGRLRAGQLLTTILAGNGVVTSSTNALRFIDNTYVLVTQQQEAINRVHFYERPSLYVGYYFCTALAIIAAIIFLAE